MRWTAEDIPDQSGRVAIVTGGNSGIGLHAARGLAAKGATVVLASRDARKAQDAIDALRTELPAARVEALALDLADLASVRAFAEAFAARHERLDVLVNNAGVMALPFGTTTDGFERQLGTNHFGHFALTARLLPLLERAPAARVVTVASLMHRRGALDPADLDRADGYSKWGAYSRSKLANLLFALELDRRLRHAERTVASVAAHPGYAATNLPYGAGAAHSGIETLAMRFGNALIAQPAAMGALPTLYAATAPDVGGGDYIGPDGWRQLRGHPVRVRPSATARDPGLAADLWRVSERRVGLPFLSDATTSA